MFTTDWVRLYPRPFNVVDKVLTYLNRTYPPKPKGGWFDEAVARARSDYKLTAKINPFTLLDSVKHFQHPETSPGIPFTSMGFRRKDEVPFNIIKEYVRRFKKKLWTKCAEPCNAVCRSVVSKKPKFRLIWVYPVHMIMAEGMFAQPLINAYRSERKSYALWVQYAKGHLRSLQKQCPRGMKWLGLDYSSYDQTVPPWLIRTAFDIIAENIDFTRYHNQVWPPIEQELRNLWRVIVNYFINTPVRLPSGQVLIKRGGVPSGSYFTSLVDSVCNSIIKHALLQYIHCRYSRIANWELGDDSLVAVEDNFNLDELIAAGKLLFGVEVNSDKTEFGPLVSFLGYKMTPSGVPEANYEKLIAQLCLPERPDRNLYDYCTRIKALQLSCFGVGCMRFTIETQSFLERHGLADFTPSLSKRLDLYTKLQALDLADFPLLTKVMQRV